MYHFEGDAGEGSLELSFEELCVLIGEAGFEIEETRWTVCPYVQNPASMLQTIYHCALMKMRKPQ